MLTSIQPSTDDTFINKYPDRHNKKKQQQIKNDTHVAFFKFFLKGFSPLICFQYFNEIKRNFWSLI